VKIPHLIGLEAAAAEIFLLVWFAILACSDAQGTLVLLLTVPIVIVLLVVMFVCARGSSRSYRWTMLLLASVSALFCLDVLVVLTLGGANTEPIPSFSAWCNSKSCDASEQVNGESPYVWANRQSTPG